MLRTLRLVHLTPILFLILPCVLHAIDVEQTIIVPPGTQTMEIVLSDHDQADIVDVFQPQHGDLQPLQDAILTYTPGSSFWWIRADFAVVQWTLETGQSETRRLRFVAGDTAYDAAVVSDDPAMSGSWPGWSIVDPDGHLSTLPGILTPLRHLIPGDQVGVTPELQAALPDDEEQHQSGQNTTTSTTTVDVEIRDIPKSEDPPQPTREFLVIVEEGVEIVSARVEWSAADEAWQISLASGAKVSVSYPLENGIHRVVVTRWTNHRSDDSGTDLRVEDTLVASLSTPPHVDLATETHILTMASLVASSTEVTFELPTAALSDSLVDSTARSVYDGFDSSAVSSSWAVYRPVVQTVTTQRLSWPGYQLDFDLGALPATGSSFLEIPITGFSPTRYQVPGPDGYGVRFWVDPSHVSIPAQHPFSLVAGCQSTGGCGAFRVWLDHDGTSLRIGLNARHDDGSISLMYAPVTATPHVVEVRLQPAWAADVENGWAELWIDGVLIGRTTGIDNHTRDVAMVRIGVIEDPDTSTGTLSYDEIEVWSFD
ncbi:MAG: hypothetical protein AAGD38_15435 [Acidobacteriota bacterium]